MSKTKNKWKGDCDIPAGDPCPNRHCVTYTEEGFVICDYFRSCLKEVE